MTNSSKDKHTLANLAYELLINSDRRRMHALEYCYGDKHQSDDDAIVLVTRWQNNMPFIFSSHCSTIY